MRREKEERERREKILRDILMCNLKDKKPISKAMYFQYDTREKNSLVISAGLFLGIGVFMAAE